MNFSHIMPKELSERKCSETNGECYWMPAGLGRATQGKYMHLTMFCTKCNHRHDLFLTHEEYQTQAKLLEKEFESND